MHRHAVFAVVLAFAAFRAAGSEPWHTTAAALHGNLPVVGIDFGYPGRYASVDNSPIRLHARSSAAFDGYIGFRFAAGPAFTVDVPIMARADMPANSDWSFRTSTQLDKRAGPIGVGLDHRQLVIEWRNRSFEVIARRNAGRPPWSPSRPLRILSAGEPDVARTYGGEEAVSLHASDLARDAQWYRGFRSIVVAVETWLDLAPAVREAIFHSGLPVIFFGVPRADQRLTSIDRALLPVLFDAPPASWRAVPGAQFLGATTSPSIVATELALYFANKEMASHPFPAMQAELYLSLRPPAAAASSFSMATLLQRPMLFPALGAALVTLLLAVQLRRRTSPVIVIPAFVAAVLILATHGRIRPLSATMTSELWISTAPGTTNHRWTDRVYGASPLGEGVAREVASTISMRGGLEDEGEVRRDDTPPGFGVLLTHEPWDYTVRSRERRELDDLASIRARDAGAGGITIDYQLPFAADGVIATWSWRGKLNSGQVHLGGLRRGTTTIQTMPGWWPSYEERWDLFPFPSDFIMTLPRQRLHHGAMESISLRFMRGPAAQMQFLQWCGNHPSTAAFLPYYLPIELRAVGDRMVSATLVLPDPAFPAKGRFRVSLPPQIAAESITVIGEGGSVRLEKGEARAAAIARVTKAHQLVRIEVITRRGWPPIGASGAIIMEERP